MEKNKSTNMNDELLMAYIDDEVDKVSRRRIENFLEQDPKLCAYANAVIQMRELIQLAYKDIEIDLKGKSRIYRIRKK